MQKERKKIGLVTFYKDNFGSILQCFATKIYIEKIGYRCDVLYQIASSVENRNGIGVVRKTKTLMKVIVNSLKYKNYYKNWKKSKHATSSLTNESLEKMNRFVDEYIFPIGKSWEELCEIGEDENYIAFVVGSDQVWNMYNGYNPLYFLEFTSQCKRIAFAPSFGVDSPSLEFIELIKKGINKFDDISVREESGKVIVKDTSSKTVQRLCDPTLLITKEEWNSLIAEKTKQLYILVHFLNEPNSVALNMIDELQRKTDYEIVCIAYKYKCLEKTIWKFKNCDPRDYIFYIKNASVVCTDSFHTTLFSINFNKQFYTFDRQYMHGYPQTGRLNDLLLRYGLQNRFVKKVDLELLKETIDWDRVNCIITEERNIASEYLKSRLRIIGEQNKT